MQLLKGLFAPLTTPFTDDASTVSEVRFARQVRYLHSQPVAGFIACSDTGEFAALGNGERKQIVEWLARDAQGKPFLVHVSALSTSTTLDIAQHASRHGAAANVLMPPFYGVYTADEILSYLRTVAQHTDIPLIVVDPLHLISSEVLNVLSDLPNVKFGSALEDTPYAGMACAKGITASDEFSVDECVVTPLALLCAKDIAEVISGAERDLAKLIILEETLGKARISKAALEVLGIEVGPLRGPLKPLAGAVTTALNTLLGK